MPFAEVGRVGKGCENKWTNKYYINEDSLSLIVFVGDITNPETLRILALRILLNTVL